MRIEIIINGEMQEYIMKEIAEQSNKESIEKQIPVKIQERIDLYVDGNGVSHRLHSANCPVCRANISSIFGYISKETTNYCNNCGQRLEWEIIEKDETVNESQI